MPTDPSGDKPLVEPCTTQHGLWHPYIGVNPGERAEVTTLTLPELDMVYSSRHQQVGL